MDIQSLFIFAFIQILPPKMITIKKILMMMIMRIVKTLMMTMRIVKILNLLQD